MRFNFRNKSKNALFSLSLTLLLATTIMMTFAQPGSAQVGVTMPEKTVGYASVAPTLIGVGQEATVNLWVFPLPTTYDYHPYFNGFYGVTVTFIKPDGTKDTFMPTDATGAYIAGEMQSLGALYFFYKPDQAGNWSISWTMPAQNITDSSGTVLYQGCTSNTAYFTVQTEPVLAGLLNGYPWAQIPDSNIYWSYPINANNREWYQISGDWTGVTNTMAMVQSATSLRWQPYGPGPNTPHIVWSQPIKEGGMIGGAFGTISYLAGRSTVVVMDGRVFTDIPNTTPNGQAFGQFQCIDEFTGKVMYQVNGSVTSGIHLPGNVYQQANLATPGQATVLLEGSYGSYQYPYVFGTSTVSGVTYWNYYDPMTGVLTRQIANASSAQLVDGTVLAFGAGTITGQTGRYVYRWNMTSVTNNNWPTGITWKAPMPTALAYRTPTIFAISSDLSTIVVYNYNQYWAYNADTGASLWNLTLNYQVNTNEEIPLVGVDAFLVWQPTDAAWMCYSIKTGALLWETPSVSGSPWASTWTVYSAETNDLNNLYVACPDGAMRAYSLKDGHLLWTSQPIVSTEYANNAIPYINGGLVMVDGKLYGYAGYSTGYQLDPVPRFACMVCINATNGETLYALNGGIAPCAAANGYVIGTSIFDGQLYSVGKGPTSTTVVAQQQVGGSVLIHGSILDNSPASSSADLVAMFPNGVPAISDADMSVWMDYLHMQNATLLNTPPNCNGVPVALTAVDPNGNSISIGSATSDVAGQFAYQWSPTTAGLYKIYATFAGSNSYFSSYGETPVTVAVAAPTTTEHASTISAGISETTLYMVAGAIIAAIAIVGIALGLLMIRKRP